jgi:CDP-paratose 2-epimerase
MRLLITGICGFVGSSLTKALLEHQCDLNIVGIDNFSRAGSWLNREPLKKLGVTVVHGDIRVASDLASLGAFDWVIDCAANPSVLAGVDGKSSSRQLVEHNLIGTINLLEACRQWHAGFVLLSTSRVYSIPSLTNLSIAVHEGAFQPQFTQFSPTGLSEKGISELFSTAPPVSLYGSTKLVSETLALEYGLSFEFPVWINRCGVLAGAGQFGKPDQGIFAFWLHSWREKKNLNYIGFDGAGHQVRDCLHPNDLAPLLIKQMASGIDVTKPSIVNVSGGVLSARSLHQLSSWCSQRWDFLDVGHSSSVRKFDLPWVVLDASLCQESWDWQPLISVEKILEEIACFADRNSHWISVSS